MRNTGVEEDSNIIHVVLYTRVKQPIDDTLQMLGPALAKHFLLFVKVSNKLSGYSSGSWFIYSNIERQSPDRMNLLTNEIW